MAIHANSQPSSVPATTTRQNGRFLGWKFAALSSQDTRKWQRNRRVQIPRSARVLLSGFGNVGFQARPTMPAGFIPTAVTTGDFNEDGKMDFAVSNGGDNTIYVFLGNGDDTFQAPVILYTQGQSPNWITAVCLHTSGHLDLAVTDGDSNTVEIFPSNGDGTFQSSTQVSLPQIPTFILAMDVNNDGNQDLVVGLTLDLDAIEPQFEVLLGNGVGGFSGTVFSDPVDLSLEGVTPTSWIAAGDLNNDGYIDFVITLSGAEYISYLSRAGTGFSLVNYFGYGNDGPDIPLVVGLGDMDEDGCIDAVRLGQLGLVTIAKGSCDGNFAQDLFPTAMLGDLDPAIQVVDVNGDGHLDVVGSAVFYPDDDNPEAGSEASYLVSVLDGDGKGDLSVAQVYRGGADAYSLALADFNGDNRPEIITTSSLENQVSLFDNDGSGNFGPPQGATIGYTIGPVNAPDSLTPLVVTDVNGDGKPDLLLIEYNIVENGSPELTVLLNDGTGNFLPPVRSAISVGDAFSFPAFIVGAFRNPATPDVIYVNKYDSLNSVFYVSYFAGNGNGTFNPPVVLTPNLPNPLQVVAGDFNNDGNLDFAVVGTDTNQDKWELDVFLGHGDGTFTELAPQQFPPLSVLFPQQLFAIDLNHDGKLDLLIGINGNQGFEASGDDLVEALGNGDGTFQTPTTLIPHFGAVAVADVNRDGYPDLIQSRDPNGDFGSDSIYYQPGVTVYLGSADGTFRQQPSYDLPGVSVAAPNPALVGDFNGDGIPDISIRYWPEQPAGLIEARLAILQGVGDGTFIVTGHSYQLPGPSFPIVGADFNGDGATDLVELTGLTSSFTTIPAAAAPALDIALDSSPVVGTTGRATVTLDLPATSSQTVTLSASDSAIQLSPSLQFNAGQQTQDISFTIGSGFDATHVFALYATLGTQTAVAYGTKPNPNLTVGVTAQLAYPQQGNNTNVTVEPGESFQMYFGFASQGGYSGNFSSFQCVGLAPGASCTFSASSILVLPGASPSPAVIVEFTTSSSTPFGIRTVTVSGTDGFVTGETTFRMGIGDFSLALNPSTIVVGPDGTVVPNLTSTATNQLNELLTLSCSGLPALATCSQTEQMGTNGGEDGLTIGYGTLTANDYPFQINGTADIVSHSVSAILRVGDYTASLDKTTATLTAGQSAAFNVTLTSLNHYTSSITVFCQPPANTVTCAVSPVPATLSDNGTATVQLMVTDTAVVPAIRHAAWSSLGGGFMLVSVIPWCFMARRRKPRPLLKMIALTFLVTMLSCGGNGSSGGNGGGDGGGGSGSPRTVSVSVIALATTTPTDSNNQKVLPPIVVTLN